MNIMLTISKNQLQSINSTIRNSFLERTTNYIKDIIPHRINHLNEDSLTIEIKRCYELGLKFGIKSEKNMEHFIYLNIRYETMKTTPYPSDVLSILTFPSLPEDSKIEYLEKHLLKKK